KMEMPGYEKEQIKVMLEDGYLTVSAAKEKSEEEDKKRYLRREIAESCRRSFYVGKNLTEEQIKAKYENGILRLTVPKNAPKQVQSRSIAIE
ncbi:MAG: Hsp20 family protein, partial [Clostridia bacterium]|nr:Hsp20 family protein [Clostridia bacterium]